MQLVFICNLVILYAIIFLYSALSILLEIALYKINSIVFYYSSPHGNSKYLTSCNILDPAKLNVNKHLRSVILAISHLC